jgi:hypothetical protein
LFAGARRDGAGQLVRVGTKADDSPASSHRVRRFALPIGLGLIVVVAVAILVRASFDTEEPSPDRSASGPGHGALAAVPYFARPMKRIATPVVLAPARAAAPGPTGAPSAGMVAAAPASGLQLLSPGEPRPPSAPPSPSAGGPGPGRPAAHAGTVATATREGFRGGAAGHGGGSPRNGAGAAAAAGAGGASGGKAARPADHKLALSGDAAKREAVWQRPPSEEDASSKLVARFASSGGTNLKGRVVDAETGRPSVGVAIEAHIGDSFMRAVSDSAGAFRMSGILPDRRISVWIIGRSDAFVAERIDVTSPGEGETVDAGVVRLLRGDELAAHLEGWMGVFVSRRGRRNVVAAVSPWSPADRAGLQVGDVLLSIEGRDVDGLGPRATGFLLRGPVGTKVTLAVQNRDGMVQRFQLERVLR